MSCRAGQESDVKVQGIVVALIEYVGCHGPGVMNHRRARGLTSLIQRAPRPR